MTDSSPPSEKEPPYEVVLRQKYNDPLKLKKSLDEMYGKGKYMVTLRANRYILRLPEPLQDGKRAEIEKQIQFHYND